MTRWEYTRWQTNVHEYTHVEFCEAANSLGTEGWELVAWADGYLIFKRPMGTSEQHQDLKPAARFLECLADLSRAHGLSLAHEDHQGTFIVQPYKQENITWLMGAIDQTAKKD